MEPSPGLSIELGSSWNRWAKLRTEAELVEIHNRLQVLKTGFGKPHVHAGIGVRRLRKELFEFRAGLNIRVVFWLVKPRTLRLAMCGNHDDVRTWIRTDA